MARNIDLYIDQGSDFLATFPPVTDTDGTAIDLTEYTVVSQMRRSYATLYAVQLGIDDSEFSTGIITVTLPSDETVGLVPTRYVYDITIQTPSTNIITKVYDGLITVNPGVSSKPNSILISPMVPDDWGGI